MSKGWLFNPRRGKGRDEERKRLSCTLQNPFCDQKANAAHGPHQPPPPPLPLPLSSISHCRGTVALSPLPVDTMRPCDLFIYFFHFLFSLHSCMKESRLWLQSQYNWNKDVSPLHFSDDDAVGCVQMHLWGEKINQSHETYNYQICQGHALAAN